MVGRSRVSAVARAPVTPGSARSIVTGRPTPAATMPARGLPEFASIVAPDFGMASRVWSPDPTATCPTGGGVPGVRTVSALDRIFAAAACARDLLPPDARQAYLASDFDSSAQSTRKSRYMRAH